MSYTPTPLVIDTWSSPETVAGTDLIASLDETFNNIVTDDSASMVNHVNDELAKLPAYLVSELEDIYDNAMDYTDMVYKTGSTMTGNLEAPSVSIGGEYLSPYTMRNKLINGNKTVNQRGYSDGTLSDGDYGYDRWKGSDTDVNIEQVIEQESMTTGTYTISWTGGGTATVNGTGSLLSGDSLSITVSSDISVIVPKAATHIQLEEGSVATPFEVRPHAIEESLCFRYYWRGYAVGQGLGKRFTKNAQISVLCNEIVFPVQMRSTPTMSETTVGTAEECATFAIVGGGSLIGAVETCTPTGDQIRKYSSVYDADAEL